MDRWQKFIFILGREKTQPGLLQWPSYYWNHPGPESRLLSGRHGGGYLVMFWSWFSYYRVGNLMEIFVKQDSAKYFALLHDKRLQYTDVTIGERYIFSKTTLQFIFLLIHCLGLESMMRMFVLCLRDPLIEILLKTCGGIFCIVLMEIVGSLKPSMTYVTVLFRSGRALVMKFYSFSSSQCIIAVWKPYRKMRPVPSIEVHLFWFLPHFRGICNNEVNVTYLFWHPSKLCLITPISRTTLNHFAYKFKVAFNLSNIICAYLVQKWDRFSVVAIWVMYLFFLLELYMWSRGTSNLSLYITIFDFHVFQTWNQTKYNNIWDVKSLVYDKVGRNSRFLWFRAQIVI